jgi:hypothetical protein
MRKDYNHRHRLKHGHPIQVLRTTLSLGSTTSLVLEGTAIGSCHRHRCLDRGRRNLQRLRRNYRPQQLSRIRRRRLSRMRCNLQPPPSSRIRCPRLPPPQLSQTRPRRLSRLRCNLRPLRSSRIRCPERAIRLLSRKSRRRLSRMRCNLQLLPLSQIRYLRHPPPHLSQTRRRPNHRLRRRAPRRGLCSREPIFQTDAPRRDVLALPAARMISAVPWPSAVISTIFARQTCVCGLLQLATTASSALRSAAVNRMFVRLAFLRTHTRESARESPSESGYEHRMGGQRQSIRNGGGGAADLRNPPPS